jgi:hypothetical protein
MQVIRFQNSGTPEHVYALVGLINDPSCVEVRLFASPRSLPAGAPELDTLEANLPLVAALAKYSIPRVDDVYVLFDGNFLTANRDPRLAEVQDVLDAAEISEKTLFSKETAPFTAAMEPKEAVQVLLALGPTERFTKASRKKYFEQLSYLSEAQCNAL